MRTGARRFIPARAGNTRCGGSRARGRAVHPRAGGEHALEAVGRDIRAGSSPRGRGTRHGGARCRGRARFIPARAGNTPHTHRPRTRPTVHPRAGGEHTAPVHTHRLDPGSSPRGRGTQIRHRTHHSPSRFIPARAGNTLYPSPHDAPPTVHPRAGGEHTRTMKSVASDPGSSPRGRGTHHKLTTPPIRHRFIPARAGNTASSRSSDGITAVHPRAGGEHTDSSPAETSGSHEAPRFIPARAGNTSMCRSFSGSPGSSVHPRAGGEHPDGSIATAFNAGSSPRGRGTPMWASPRRIFSRFIPARAGNTSTVPLAQSNPAVHPRAGGEHRLNTSADVKNTGSSPRGRGTPSLAPRSCPWRRFIPARAGNTRARGDMH